MHYFGFVTIAVFSCSSILADTSTLPPTSMRPVYKPQETSTAYVPHKTYLDQGVRSDGYGYPTFESYSSYPVAPTIQGPVQTILSAIYKVGYFLLGGVALFFVGGLFISAICSFTSICTITFAPLADIDKDAVVRSFMTPEKLATAAALVQDAVGKYQRLQKMKGE